MVTVSSLYGMGFSLSCFPEGCTWIFFLISIHVFYLSNHCPFNSFIFLSELTFMVDTLSV